MRDDLESKLPSPDMQAAPRALLRAARRARKIALQTNTAIVIVRDGVLVEERVTEADLEEFDRMSAICEETHRSPRRTMGAMTREDILRLVAEHRADLADLGVRELSLFGSYARGDATEVSDVDFLVELERKSFDGYMAVKELLESLLARPVDLVLKTAVKPRLREAILREAIRAA